MNLGAGRIVYQDFKLQWPEIKRAVLKDAFQYDGQ
jgi:bisphosphoglycerate-independent phosphoglycerate mutase (AlkP superfamily)